MSPGCSISSPASYFLLSLEAVGDGLLLPSVTRMEYPSSIAAQEALHSPFPGQGQPSPYLQGNLHHNIQAAIPLLPHVLTHIY